MIREKEKPLMRKFYVIILLAAVVIAFYWYTVQNTERIKNPKQGLCSGFSKADGEPDR